jgi:hypothetical protein
MWTKIGKNSDGIDIYGKTDSDGKMRITAVFGYPELDAYLAWIQEGKDPKDFYTQTPKEDN